MLEPRLSYRSEARRRRTRPQARSAPRTGREFLLSFQPLYGGCAKIVRYWGKGRTSEKESTRVEGKYNKVKIICWESRILGAGMEAMAHRPVTLSKLPHRLVCRAE
jgi:hypothetical protein